MNRNTRVLIVLGIAVVTAALASFGVYLAVTRRPPVEIEIASVHAVVAAKSLEMGVSLTTEHVKLVPWPAKTPVPGMFGKTEDVINRGLVSAVSENEPITESKLAPIEAGAGLPPAIKPGMRAMSVRVNEVIGVAGFVVPGTRVDVLVTLKNDRDTMTRVVVSNVQVLTAGTRYDEAEAKKEGKAIPSTVVTLMVAPPDAERIALASTEGQIMLALRNPLDTEATSTTGVHASSLVTSPATVATPPRPVARPRPAPVATVAEVAPPPPLPPPPPPTPLVRTVETIRAGKRDTEVLR
jgi:pilus assembly protein CpaB